MFICLCASSAGPTNCVTPCPHCVYIVGPLFSTAGWKMSDAHTAQTSATVIPPLLRLYLTPERYGGIQQWHSHLIELKWSPTRCDNWQQLLQAQSPTSSYRKTKCALRRSNSSSTTNTVHGHCISQGNPQATTLLRSCLALSGYISSRCLLPERNGCKYTHRHDANRWNR